MRIAAFVSLTALFGHPLLAEASTNNYFDIQYAASSTNNPDTDHKAQGSATVVTVGHSLPSINPYLSIEGEYSAVASTPTYSRHTHYNLGMFGGAYDYDYTEKTDYYTFAGYAVVTYPNNTVDNIRARVGLLYKDVQKDIYENDNGSITRGTDTQSGFGLTFSLGTLHRFTDNFGFILEATYIDENISQLSAGLELGF